MPAQDDFNNFWQEERTVPCNGCTACCVHEDVELKPQHGDDPAKYQTESYTNNIGNPSLRLARKPNGECVYLEGTSCTIHADRPLVCRTYDCRVAFLSFTRRMREMEVKRGNDGNFIEGEKRLHTLDARGRRAAIMVRKWRESLEHLTPDGARAVLQKLRGNK